MRFARTPDGMNLAHFSVGDGLPFLKMPAPIDHVQLLARERDDPGIRAITERTQMYHSILVNGRVEKYDFDHASSTTARAYCFAGSTR
jgi:hypothetical protein